MTHGGSNSVVTGSQMGWEPSDRVMPGVLHIAINPLLIPEGTAHARRHQPTLPLSFPLLLPSRLSLLMGLLIRQAHNRVCVLTSILKSFKLHLSSRYSSESVQLAGKSGLVILHEPT